MINERAFNTLNVAILTDNIPKRTDIGAIFVHASGGDLDKEVLGAVSAVYRRLSGTRIVLNGLNPYHYGNTSLDNPESWEKYLIAEGILKADIILTSPVKHSGAEAEQFVRMCAQRKWQRVVVATRPYHIPRCFLNHVGWAVSLGVATKFYCTTVNCDWTEEISVHRNIGGETKAMRLNHLVLELKRIRDYREKYEAGDPDFTIATPEEGLTHLVTRR